MHARRRRGAGEAAARLPRFGLRGGPLRRPLRRHRWPAAPAGVLRGAGAGEGPPAGHLARPLRAHLGPEGGGQAGAPEAVGKPSARQRGAGGDVHGRAHQGRHQHRLQRHVRHRPAIPAAARRPPHTRVRECYGPSPCHRGRAGAAGDARAVAVAGAAVARPEAAGRQWGCGGRARVRPRAGGGPPPPQPRVARGGARRGRGARGGPSASARLLRGAAEGRAAVARLHLAEPPVAPPVARRGRRPDHAAAARRGAGAAGGEPERQRRDGQRPPAGQGTDRARRRGGVAELRGEAPELRGNPVPLLHPAPGADRQGPALRPGRALRLTRPSLGGL
mmetsp:Transcript_16936/g.44836  ORF Transcript_16936/g.44836 Transcript_16936/m.44836 type:complete len:334 (-) Transcript_16936:263-1264(-)